MGDPVTASGAYDMESQTPARPEVVVMAPPEPKKKNCCCWATLIILGLLLLVWVVLELTGNGFFGRPKPQPKKWHCTNCQSIVPDGESLCDNCKPEPTISWTCSKCKKSIPGIQPAGVTLCDDCKPKKPKMVRWNEFHSTDKGRRIELSNGKRSAGIPGLHHTSDRVTGTVRAGPWVSRDGCATATIRVDGSYTTPTMAIGILAEGYGSRTNPEFPRIKNTGWEDWVFRTWDIKLTLFYHASGFIMDNSNITEELDVGTEITVTLRNEKVTFTTKGKSFTYDLPKHFKRVTLGVSMWGRSKVTLL